MRTILALAVVLVASVVPVTAGAQHGTTDAPVAHPAAASKPAAKSETAATSVPTPAETTKPAAKAERATSHDVKTASEKKPAGKPAVAAKKATTKTDLEAAFDRIAQKIGGTEVTPGGLRVSATSGSQGRAAEARPTGPSRARSEAPPRIHLVWRSAVVWPAMLDSADTAGTAPTPETSRITLAWQ